MRAETRSAAMAMLLAVLALPAQADGPEDWLEEHPIGEPLDPQELRMLDSGAYSDLPPLADGMRYAVIDGMVVALDPASYELLQVIRDVAAVGSVADLTGSADAQAPDIPPGHYPPPGSCRIWFPDRPPGQQPPPTSCDVEVPPGAFLIEG